MPTTEVKPKKCSKSLDVGFAIRLSVSVSRASRFGLSNKRREDPFTLFLKPKKAPTNVNGMEMPSHRDNKAINVEKGIAALEPGDVTGDHAKEYVQDDGASH
uniref:Uncharacterized protein n=1 Tax=Romanomermis culicivorax TaxID=13658 RepID=A0A915I886_ROMCU